MTNLTLRLDFFEYLKDNISLFQYVQLSGTEKPEDVAFKLYGDPALFWIVLWSNNIVDPYYDWILTEKQLQDYIKTKYGALNLYSVHHYETTATHRLGAGVIVNQSDAPNQPITNYEYEYGLNELKRKIKVVDPSYINQVVSEFNSILYSAQ